MPKKVFFVNSRGDRLCGILSGESPAAGAPIAVLCHGFTTGKDGRTNTRLEALLNRGGIATFRFDFFGHGESEGDLADITVSEAVDDAHRALDYVRGRGYGRTALIGSSFGGMAAVLAAAQRTDLTLLALKSPVSDYMSRLLALRDGQEIESWREKGFAVLSDADGGCIRLNYGFYEDAEKARGFDAAADILIPTLIVHGSEDETVPLGQSRRLADLLPDARLEVIPGADHRYSREADFDRMIALIEDFVFSRLG